jgi:hypothetical protein
MYYGCVTILRNNDSAKMNINFKTKLDDSFALEDSGTGRCCAVLCLKQYWNVSWFYFCKVLAGSLMHVVVKTLTSEVKLILVEDSDI